jgi:hypothetical protein
MTTQTIEEQFTNLPVPPPPVRRPNDFPTCPDFSFITDAISRSCIETGYKGVQITEGWNAIRNFSGDSFMFTNDPEITRIMNAVNAEYGGGHSGCSIGWTMRQLERISHIGINAFKSEWLNAQRERAEARERTTTANRAQWLDR